MTEVKRYHVGDTGLVEGVSLGRITVVLCADFDRVQAERDALQQRLTVSDQENDNLKTEIKIVPPVKAGDPFDTCLECFGAGTICTGIEEASSTICNKCDGTGRKQP